MIPFENYGWWPQLLSNMAVFGKIESARSHFVAHVSDYRLLPGMGASCFVIYWNTCIMCKEIKLHVFCCKLNIDFLMYYVYQWYVSFIFKLKRKSEYKRETVQTDHFCQSQGFTVSILFAIFWVSDFDISRW